MNARHVTDEDTLQDVLAAISRVEGQLMQLKPVIYIVAGSIVVNCISTMLMVMTVLGQEVNYEGYGNKVRMPSRFNYQLPPPRDEEPQPKHDPTPKIS